MSFGKMKHKIMIVETVLTKDTEGFKTATDRTLATVRAYREDRHGNERWANMAAFSTATALFRFRKVPKLEMSTSHFIVCGAERFRIVSVEANVRGRGMYTEVMTERMEGTVR